MQLSLKIQKPHPIPAVPGFDSARFFGHNSFNLNLICPIQKPKKFSHPNITTVKVSKFLDNQNHYTEFSKSSQNSVNPVQNI